MGNANTQVSIDTQISTDTNHCNRDISHELSLEGSRNTNISTHTKHPNSDVQKEQSFPVCMDNSIETKITTDAKQSGRDISEELRCPVCLEIPEPPFSMCRVGHIVCRNCKPRIQSCPVCRTSEFQPYRNVTLENIMRKVLYPCEEQDSGCPELLSFDQRIKHKSECFYVARKCPFAQISNEKCSWSGLPKDIKQHIKDGHQKKVDYTEVNGQFLMGLDNMSPSKHYCKAVFTLDELFYVVWATRDDSFYCAVLLVGPNSNTNNYKYKIIITLPNDSKIISICLHTRNFMEDINDILMPGECASLHYRMVQKFMDPKNSLVCKMEINKFAEEKLSAIPTEVSGSIGIGFGRHGGHIYPTAMNAQSVIHDSVGRGGRNDGAHVQNNIEVNSNFGSGERGGRSRKRRPKRRDVNGQNMSVENSGIGDWGGSGGWC